MNGEWLTAGGIDVFATRVAGELNPVGSRLESPDDEIVVGELLQLRPLTARDVLRTPGAVGLKLYRVGAKLCEEQMERSIMYDKPRLTDVGA